MNTSGFRQAAMERLAAPDQVDEILRVNASKEWIALIGAFLVLAAAGIWAFEGRLPAKSQGKGVIVRSGGVLNVVTLGGGLVLSVNAKVGDRIKANQVIGQVAQPALLERIKAKQLELDQMKGEREAALKASQAEARLTLDAIELQRANALREISDLEVQVQLASEQIPIEEQLLAKRLVTKQQTIAAKQKRVTLQQQIAGRQAAIKHLDAQRFATESHPQQADADRIAKIKITELAYESLRKELTLAQNIASPYSGEVIEVKVDAGTVLQPASPILSIQSDVSTLEALVFVPSLFAKNVMAEMEAEVSPSTVRREEYGFIRGKVSYVAQYPVTSAALMRYFQNESLVKSLTELGPVTEVRVQMTKDTAAFSGFRWSSSKGPQTPISSGTICGVEIITRQQRPIELLLPYLKAQFGV